MDTGTTDQLAAFAELAERYCAIIDAREQMQPDGFLHAVHLHLARLYLAGLLLPSIEICDGDETDDDEETEEPTAWTGKRDHGMSHAEWYELFASLKAYIGEQRDYYAHCSDPDNKPHGPSGASLSDDLANIYRDLKSGLAKWHRGELENALWEWRFHFTTHWGEHAVTALKHTALSLVQLHTGAPLSTHIEGGDARERLPGPIAHEQMSRHLHLYFDGIPMGTVENIVHDMWYMEGRWIPAADPEAARFTDAIRKQDMQTSILNYRGILVRYRTDNEETLLDGLVVGMAGENMVVRELTPEAAATLKRRGL